MPSQINKLTKLQFAEEKNTIARDAGYRDYYDYVGAEYDKNTPASKIGKVFGVSANAIICTLRGLGVTLRPKGGNNNPIGRPLGVPRCSSYAKVERG